MPILQSIIYSFTLSFNSLFAIDGAFHIKFGLLPAWKYLIPLHASSKKRIDQITTFSTPFYSKSKLPKLTADLEFTEFGLIFAVKSWQTARSWEVSKILKKFHDPEIEIITLKDMYLS